MLNNLRSAGVIWPTLVTIPVVAFLLGLEPWQMQRKAWKEQLITQIEERKSATPQDLVPVVSRMLQSGPGEPEAWSASKMEAMNYTPFRVSGRFDYARERFYYAPDQKLGPGYHVFTPLLLAPIQNVAAAPAVGLELFVNRGFIPERLKDPRSRAEGNPPGTISVTGLWRTPSPAGLITPNNDAANNVWLFVDLPAMSGKPMLASAKSQGAAGKASVAHDGRVLPFYLDATALPANIGGWPKGGTTILVIPNRHLEYALTWYGLAVTLVGVYLVFVVNKLRTNSP